MRTKGNLELLAMLPLFIVGIVACVIWHRLIRLYQTSIAWRHERLIEMDTCIPGSLWDVHSRGEILHPGWKISIHLLRP